MSSSGLGGASRNSPPPSRASLGEARAGEASASSGSRSSTAAQPPVAAAELSQRPTAHVLLESAASQAGRRAGLPGRHSADKSPASTGSSGAEAAALELKRLAPRLEVIGGIALDSGNVPQAEELLKGVLPQAEHALGTYETLSRLGSSAGRDVNEAAEKFLPKLATIHLLAHKRLLQIYDKTAPGSRSIRGTADEIPALKELRRELDGSLGLMEKTRQMLESKGNADLLPGKELPSQLADSARREINEHLLLAQVQHLSLNLQQPDLRRSFDELGRAVIEAWRLTNQVRLGHEEDKNAFRQMDLVDRLADQFAVRIDTAWDAPDDQWQGMLDFAGTLKDVLNGFRKTIADHAARLASQDAPQERQPASQASPPSTASPNTASSSKSRKKKGKSNRPAAADAASNERALTLDRANQMVNSRALTLKLAGQFGGDPLAIARSSGLNTAELDDAVQDGDPHKIASTARNSARRWFGRMDALTDLHEKLDAQLKAHPGDEKLEEALSQIGDRMQALGLVQQRIRADEADALKRSEAPVAPQLQRLLNMGEIAGVGALAKLKSDDDVGDQGKLFELEIQLKPKADGTAADPLYLHVHTSKLVSAEECAAAPFHEHDAVHVKTASQRKLGRRWEQFQQALGRADAKVHRGEVDESLLKQLLAVRTPAPH